MNRTLLSSLTIVFLLLAQSPSYAQQEGDLAFNPPVEDPVFEAGQGPRIAIDGGHNNFHQVGGRYRAFADLLRGDGYVVGGLEGKTTPESLENIDILVIANAIAEENLGNWRLPTPSAFDKEEIDAIETWVESGGSLLLIADHMPFPGAAEMLAVRFGVEMTNSFAYTNSNAGRITFSRQNGWLADHPVTSGRNESERIDRVTSFTGQAFRIHKGIVHQPLLTFPDESYILLPIEAWEFGEDTAREDASGMLQGVTLIKGEGRIAIFGEAAMFTAQVAGEAQRPMGMNHPEADQNYQFLLNLVHWLSGII